jgi:membrane associated rhomboid family serine protease
MIPLKDNIKSRSLPFVNWILIALNGFGFYKELSQPPQALAAFLTRWSLVPAKLAAAPDVLWPTLFTSMFLHGGWLHLLGNMLYLWIFGDNVEDRMGHRRYFLFYLLCGLLAALGQMALNTESTVPMVGASGAIAGVLGAYFLLYPKARITAVVPIWIFLRVVDIPAVFFLGFWFVIQALQGWGTLALPAAKGAAAAAGGIAWGAHAAGFVSGCVLVFFFKKPLPKSKR